MRLHIFKAGQFEVKEVNDFINSNIIEKINFLNDGSIYLLFKDFNEAGSDDVKKIELLDEIIKQNQGIIFTTTMEMEQQKIAKADLEKKIEDLVRQKEGLKPFEQKKIDKDIEKWKGDLHNNELQTKAAEDTIDQKTKHNAVCLARLDSLILQPKNNAS